MCIHLWETHSFPIPFLSAPAQSIVIDDAGASATASRVFCHGYLQIGACQQRNGHSLSPQIAAVKLPPRSTGLSLTYHSRRAGNTVYKLIVGGIGKQRTQHSMHLNQARIAILGVVRCVVDTKEIQASKPLLEVRQRLRF